MKWKLNIRREFKVTVALIGVSLLIAFSERKQGAAVCENIVIELDNAQENHFIDEAEVLQMVESGTQRIKGTSVSRLNLKEIEGRLKNDKHIRKAELYNDLKGNLIVNVELRRPIARIVQDNAPDAYIAEDGTIMSVSEKYTSRVMLISGPFVKQMIEQENLNETDQGKQLMGVIEFVNHDDFWRAQIAQMDIDTARKILIYPQVTGQRVEFGRPENVEVKFRKLMIFYKEILPQRGWTRYQRVNLEYEGQVIAE
jgi:cell division protein FtsQ